LSRPISSWALLRRDGRPVTESAIDRALTTQDILDQEAGIIACADRQLAADGPDLVELDVPVDHLTGPQREAAAAVAGDDPLVMIVGPAGTGKTTALAAAVAQLEHDGRPVFGVAPSAAAAAVLAHETGMPTDTVHKLLSAQRHDAAADSPYRLAPGTTVVIDSCRHRGYADGGLEAWLSAVSLLGLGGGRWWSGSA
jgi:ATP-dependent exoDNAse (exonuclease V) alpha subunit